MAYPTALVKYRKPSSRQVSRRVRPRARNQSQVLRYQPSTSGALIRPIARLAGAAYRYAMTPRKKHVKKIEPPSQAAQFSATGALDTVTLKYSKSKAKSFTYPRALTHYTQDFNGVKSSASGVQAANMLMAVNTVEQFLNSTGIAYTYKQADQALINLDPEAKITGSANAFLPAGTVLNKALAITSNKFNIILNNGSASGAYIDLYLIECIKACPYDPVSQWNRGLIDQAAGQGSVTQTPAGATTNTSAVPIGYANATVYGQKPYMSRSFKTFYKVCAVRSTKLGAGCTEAVNFDIKAPRTFKQEVVQEYLTNGILFQPGSFYVMSVQHGVPMKDDTGGATTVATLSNSQFWWVGQATTNFGTSPKWTSRPPVTSYANNLSAPTTANQKFISQIALPTGINTTLLV